MALLEVTNVKKIYSTRFGGNKVQALFNVTFSVEEGEYVAIMGESGSGKTTLLNILAALDRPTSGEVLLEGKSITHLTEKEISAFRRKNLGFVFQDFNLLDTFSLRDNLSSSRAGRGRLSGDGAEDPSHCKSPSHQPASGKIPLRGFRRTEAESSSCKGTDHRSEADPCGTNRPEPWIPVQPPIFFPCSMR